MEVERELLDALSVIISSGYFLEQDDFIDLIKLLRASDQTDHAVERAKLYEFVLYAAKLFEFDFELIKSILTESWEREVIELEAQESIAFDRAMTMTEGDRASVMRATVMTASTQYPVQTPIERA